MSLETWGWNEKFVRKSFISQKACMVELATNNIAKIDSTTDFFVSSQYLHVQK